MLEYLWDPEIPRAHGQKLWSPQHHWPKSGLTPYCLEGPGCALLRATSGSLMDSQCCGYLLGVHHPMVVPSLLALDPTCQGELQTPCPVITERGWTLTAQLMAYFCTRELLVA